MDGDGDLSELAFCIAGYKKNIKAFSQNYNPLLKMVPEREKTNYENPDLKAFAGSELSTCGTWTTVG